MKWKYDNVLQEHQLLSNGNSKIARIQMAPRKKGGFLVKTLVDVIYYGQKRQELMEKQKKEWMAYRKKFKEKQHAIKYIERKKEEVRKFITVREQEV